MNTKTKTNVERGSGGLCMPDARTVNPGQAVRYHAEKFVGPAMVEPIPASIADRLIEIIDREQRCGELEESEARRLRAAVVRRTAGAR